MARSHSEHSDERLLSGDLRQQLLAWYDGSKRDLPWRRTADPYRIWIAEVMLVQTQVEVVMRYYDRFLDRFPNVASLAAAELDEVLKLWEGLGYYARARNLHKAARLIVERHDGRLPEDHKSLCALPGIGIYVAAAVASIAFGERVAAVDGNVRRVIARLHDLPEPTDREIRELARHVVQERPGDTNQALMDLGSTVCTARSPGCERCPIASHCLARDRGTQSERPLPRRSGERPHYEIAVGVVWRNEEILIAKRNPEGLLGGLWEFPGGKRRADESLEAAVVREVGEELGVEVQAGEKIAEVEHAYSHFSITMHAYHCRYETGTPEPLGCQDYAWVRPQDLDRYAFPAANRRVLQHLFEAGCHDGRS